VKDKIKVDFIFVFYIWNKTKCNVKLQNGLKPTHQYIIIDILGTFLKCFQENSLHVLRTYLGDLFCIGELE